MIFNDMPSVKKGPWPQPSIEMIDLLERHISRFDAERRKMFGFPCYFVNGNMFAGTFSNNLFARFSVEDKGRLDVGGLGEPFEPVKGRRMTEYRTLSKKVLDEPKDLDEWLDRSYAYVSSLEAKIKG